MINMSKCQKERKEKKTVSGGRRLLCPINRRNHLATPVSPAHRAPVAHQNFGRQLLFLQDHVQLSPRQGRRLNWDVLHMHAVCLFSRPRRDRTRGLD